MNNLINLGKLIEKFNANSDCVAEARIRSDGVLIELRKDIRLQKLISWEDIRHAKVDVLATNFNQMVEEFDLA